MKKGIVALIVVAVVIAAVAMRTAQQRNHAPARSIEDIHLAEGVPVDVVTARSGTIVVARDIVGVVAGMRQSVLRASDDYKIAEVMVREGVRVRRGQTLVRYDVDISPDNMARFAQVQEAYANAKRQVERLEPLFERGAVSESDLDAARTQLAVAAADLRNARLELEVASPIDGVAVLIGVSRGDAVQSGAVVAQVAVLDSVRISADVSAATAAELRTGAVVRLTDATGGDQSGRITRVALASDPDTRLFRVEAVMANTDRRLRPGSIVTMEVTVSEAGPVTVLPQSAVVGAGAAHRGEKVEVFVVRDGVAHRVAVDVGEAAEDVFEARTGVGDGELVVVFGANHLSDGALARLHRVDGALVESGVDREPQGGGDR